MNKIFTSIFLRISEAVDQIVHKADHRFIRNKNLGIAYGECTLKQFISQINCDMVFDVGANIGQYGLQLRQKIGYRGPLLSFEPIPHAANQVRAAAKDDSMWQVRECAIDNVSGRAAFNVMTDDQFSSLLLPAKYFDGRFHGKHSVKNNIDVEVITLGDAVRNAPPFTRGLLKLDTQGTELRIINSGASLLHLFPCIQIEIGFQPIYEGEDNYAVAINQLEQHGYRLCALFPNNHGHFPHLLEMDAIFFREELLTELP